MGGRSPPGFRALGGEQTAHNVLTSCRGCICQRGGAERTGMSHLWRAAGNWSLGRMLRWKHWPSRWWDSRPPGKRSRGYTMRYINKRGYWALTIWARTDGSSWLRNLHFGRAEVGFCQARRRSTGSHCAYSVAQPPDWISLPETRTHTTRPSKKPGRHTKERWRLPIF